MSVGELIAALEARGPEARELPVVYVDVDYGPQDPEPRIEELTRWLGEILHRERRVLL